MAAKLVLAALLALAAAAPADAEETKIVGSSTVSKFATAAQTRLAARGAELTIETTGTGGGFSLFCSSENPLFAPVTLASRPIKDAEREACRANGIDAVDEHVLGLSGVVVLSQPGPKPPALTRQDLFLALAANTPVNKRDCRLAPNPRRRWSEVRAGLPNAPITVLGPPTTSGTRASFLELAVAKGAEANACMAALKETDPAAFKQAVSDIRRDGVWIDAGENDSVVVAAVRQIPHALGIVGFPVYTEFRDEVAAAAIDGVFPDRETIAAQRYPLSRRLLVYAKRAALEENADARAFIAEITGPAATGPAGYLLKDGLVPIAP